jgi:two-component system phosphate regulon sensor histidine kinase PhoR
MERTGATRIKRLQRSLKLTSAIVWLSVGVLVPVILSTAVGIAALVAGESSETLLLGVLITSFAASAAGGAIVVTVLLGRRARTARLQADLLANVSHELRTPLSSIRMYAQTLDMGVLEEDPVRMKKCVKTILRETEWLESMIDRVLTWRSLAKDRDDLDLVYEPIREAVEESAKRFIKMISTEEVDFSVEITSTEPVLHDKRGLNSILINLLVNALKYTGDSKKIKLLAQDEGDQVVVSVEDNGIGIPEAEVKRIFEPFYRADSQLKGKASGAGLGLAIVSHLVRAHSGTLSVDSVEGEGSIFIVSLPTGDGELPEA